jgi:hypothetical protein
MSPEAVQLYHAFMPRVLLQALIKHSYVCLWWQFCACAAAVMGTWWHMTCCGRVHRHLLVTWWQGKQIMDDEDYS